MITAEYIRECISYDPRSGSLTWKNRPPEHFISVRYMRIFNTQFSGCEAGTPRKKAGNPNIYRGLSISTPEGKRTLECHRVAFAIYHGYWPEMVDHFDGNTLNNAISNLRPATKSINGKNRHISIHNTSGIPGVSRNGSGWVVHGCGNPKAYIGRFTHIFDAACARKSYELANGYTERHGGIR